MTVVSNSSPLIVLAKIGCFDLLYKLFGAVTISSEVYSEVVVKGAGQPGAVETAGTPWIQVRPLDNPADLRVARERLGLGTGELSTILLAKQLKADLIILDDLGARKLARGEGFRVQGSIGVLEASFAEGHLSDLRQVYGQLLVKGVYLDRRLLDASLRSLNLPSL